MRTKRPLQFPMRTFTSEAESPDQQIEINQVKSIYDKINDINVLKNGEVIHNLYTFTDENGKIRKKKFKDMESFNLWREQRIHNIISSYRKRLTPH